MPIDSYNLMSTNELASRLQVSRKFVYELVKQGCPCIKKTGKQHIFDYDEVIIWLKVRAKKETFNE